jgi:hypothetical protein
MSRGYGHVQRFILDTLKRTAVDSEYGPPIRLWPIPALASAYGDHLYATGRENSYVAKDWSTSPSIRHALSRAALRLEDDRAVVSWTILMHTQLSRDDWPITERWVVSVGLPGMGDLTKVDVEDAELLLFHRGSPEYSKRVAQAQAEMAESRRHLAEVLAKAKAEGSWPYDGQNHEFRRD